MTPEVVENTGESSFDEAQGFAVFILDFFTGVNSGLREP